MNKIDRFQIVLLYGKTLMGSPARSPVDFKIVNENNELVEDGTLENFSSTHINPLVVEANQFLKQKFAVE